MRSSKQVNRHRTVEELLADHRAVQMGIATNADVARAWRTGLHDFAKLDRVQRVRFSLTADLFFHAHERLNLHYRDSRMSREVYEPQRLTMKDFLGHPGLQAIWETRRRYFHTGYRSMVDGLIAVLRAGPLPDRYGEAAANTGQSNPLQPRTPQGLQMRRCSRTVFSASLFGATVSHRCQSPRGWKYRVPQVVAQWGRRTSCPGSDDTHDWQSQRATR